MKRLTLACLLLSFLATSSVGAPAPQSDRQIPGPSKCGNGIKECKESLNDFKDAEQFKQLKAAVLADLDWLERSSPTKPKFATVRAVDVNRQENGNPSERSSALAPHGKSTAKAMNTVQPVALKSVAATPGYALLP
jgi:hypothetical protein